MKQKYTRLLLALCALTIGISSVRAVPAYRGWQTKTQPDGTAITLRLVGDEFYHYWETEDGKIAVEQPDGTFVVTAENRPTGEQIKALRKAADMYKSQPHRAIGKRNFAPKGLVILVQFANVSFKTANDATAFDNMLNQEGYNYGGATGSAVDYFKAQSNGQYVPAFDVFGPVTLPNNLVYYGEQGTINGSNENDMYIADFVIDAVKTADAAGCDFSKYDSDSDGKVDIVYFFYAGKGQAAGGTSETIWPHNWELASALYYGQTHGNSGYSYSNLPRLDGKTINNYVCSAELKSDGSRSGIGTLCHEFSHVLGLPDYYDTEYGTNNDNGVTPGTWSLMDQGSYNNNEMTPPNYSIYDKYFMGWATPKLLAKDAKANVTMTTEYDDAYQITGGTSLLPYNNTGTIYYIENRQKTGWDAGLPGSGMLVWQVKYNSTAWNNNEPNNTASNPRCTIVPADGKTKNYGYATDLFPTSSVKSYMPATGCAITEIAKSSGNITFKYNGGATGHEVVVSATGCTVAPSATTVENGTTLSATITPTDDTYDYTSLTVKLGTTTLTGGTHYTLSSDKKTLTIKSTAITGDASNKLTITVVWTKNRYKYELLGENCTEELSGTVAKNGSLSLTITPDAGYTLADAACWEVLMGGTTLTYGTGFTYNSSTNTFSIASVTGDVDIYAYGGSAITWSANGSVIATNVVVSGALSLPDTPADCSGSGGKKFVGWTESSSIIDGAKPNDLFTSATGKNVTGSTTYYAVYATQSAGGGSGTPEKATSIAVGDEVILVYENGDTKKEMTGFSSTSTVYGIATDYTTTPAGTYTFEVAAGYSTGTYALKHDAVYASWSSGNSLTSSATLDTNSSWTISFSSGNAVIANANTPGRTIYYNTGSPRFACYTSALGAVQLYKMGSSASYSDYSLTCGVPCANTPTMSFTPITVSKTTADGSFTRTVTISGKGSGQTVVYSSSDETIATVNSSGTVTLKGKVGTTTITASVAANGTYCAAGASYTLRVTAAPINVTLYYNGTSATLSNQTSPYTLPTTAPYNTAMCDGDWTFAGWYGSEYDKSTTAPTFITELTATGSAYVVYTTTETSSSTPQRKATATAGTTLWAEDFSGFSKDEVPSSANTGTTVYGSATITYSVANGGGTTKVYNESAAGGTSPELLIAKSKGSLTVSGIPSGDATEMALTFTSNKSSFSVTTTETTKLDISGSGTSWTISVKAGQTAPETFDLTIENTSSSNSRVDNINLTVTIAGSGGGSTTTTYYATTPDCPIVEPCALTGIELNTSGVMTSFVPGATLDYTGLVVTANYSNCSSQTVEPASVTVSSSMETVGSKTVTVSYTENEMTKTATYTITVAELKYYTVTWVSCGDVIHTDTFAEGATLVLPPTPGRNAGKSFVGWTATEHYTGDGAPADMFNTAGSRKVTADVTYYAVFN